MNNRKPNVKRNSCQDEAIVTRSSNTIKHDVQQHFPKNSLAFCHAYLLRAYINNVVQLKKNKIVPTYNQTI